MGSPQWPRVVVLALNPGLLLSSACAPGNTSRAVEPLGGPAGRTGNNSAGEEEPHRSFRSYENTTVWLLCTTVCLLVALVFSKGKPFREPVYKNCEDQRVAPHPSKAPPSPGPPSPPQLSFVGQGWVLAKQQAASVL